MSESSALQPWQGAIANSERKFTEIVEAAGTLVVFKIESMFALQAITGNEYLMKIANSNPNSLRDSIINISSIGLSLNPATGYAYLVPRDGSACLDISYKGLIKLATDSGSMIWVRAELVYENDTFKFLGPARQPEHEADVFGDRGKMVGVYCIAKTKEGDILTEIMTSKDIDQVKATSKAKNGPWKNWENEMIRKTVIKRASKTWPRSDKNDRLAEAVHVINSHEGINPEEEPVTSARFEIWLDALYENGKSIEEIEEAYSEKSTELSELNEVERRKADGYKKQLVEMMVEDLKPVAPKTFTCSSGLEVTTIECEQCPKSKECKEFKTHKENT